ncbi:MAG: HAD hydrolase family protein [Anaerolineales bacterium]|nr:HAD hydrolase family protein [Anaerolineales bacterium]
MVDDMRILAIIPARGGSKSIAGKNIRLFAGHPLLAYSIAAGLQAESVDRVIVSTDDETTAEIARNYGAEVPFMRPYELALDATPDLPVFEHALSWLEREEGYRPEIIVQLRPTTPLRPLDCVDRGVSILMNHPEADSVRAVVPSGQNPYKMWRISDDGRLAPLMQTSIDEPYNQPRQNLPPTYWQTGHLDVIRRDVIFEKGSMSGSVILPLVLEPRYTVDIDTPNDWERAEWKLIHGDLDVVRPGRKPRPIPDKVELIILDFDGVLTDNRVWTDSKGRELVAANRSDGHGISRLKEHGIQIFVLSTEVNPVVEARCRKLGLDVVQGVEDKGSVLRELLHERGIQPANTVYLGNDINDLPCFHVVGCAVVVNDALPDVLHEADLVLRRPGGYGAVRELSDLILSSSTTSQ